MAIYSVTDNLRDINRERERERGREIERRRERGVREREGGR